MLSCVTRRRLRGTGNDVTAEAMRHGKPCGSNAKDDIIMSNCSRIGTLLCIIAIVIVMAVPAFRGTTNRYPPPSDLKELTRWMDNLEHSRDTMYRWFCVASALGGAGIALIIAGCGKPQQEREY